MSFCKNCGNELNENAVFCSKCGNQVNDIQSLEKEDNISTNKLKTKKRSLVILGIMLGVVLVIVAAFGIIKNVLQQDERESGNLLFHNGLALVKEGEFWGYINEEGKVVIEPQYEEAYNFSDGLALVLDECGEYGYINTKGKYEIEPQFKQAESFSDGLAVISYVDYAKFGYIDTKGEVVVEPQFATAYPFSHGVALVKKNDLYGYVSNKGEFITDIEFVQAAESFSEGLACVRKENEQCGYINTKGEYVIEPQFDDASDFSEGLALVLDECGEYGYINTKGEYEIEPQFKRAESFADGLALVVDENGKYGYINTEGEYEIEPQFEKAYSFENGLTRVYVSAKEGFKYMNKDGEFIDETSYESSVGLIPRKSGELWGYVNQEGELVIPYKYRYAFSFYDDGYAVVVNDEKEYIIIDENGKEIITQGYDRIDEDSYTFRWGEFRAEHSISYMCEEEGCYEIGCWKH